MVFWVAWIGGLFVGLGVGFFLGVTSTWKSIDQCIKFGAMLRKGKAYEITLIRKIS